MWPLSTTDEVYNSLNIGEIRRQQHEMELIASENYVSVPILRAIGSVFTNKYSEGYPGKRYYAGQEFTDQIETLAIDRAKLLFRAQYVNVQPLSGSPANLAAYLALLQPGDKILGMSLAAGGHLTHGATPSATSKLWKAVQYSVDTSTGLIDYDELREIALRERPNLIVAGFSAYTRTVDWRRIKAIADEVGAKTMADIAHIAGLVVSGLLENPIDVGFDVVTSTTHKTLRGPRGGIVATNDEKLAKAIDKAIFPGLQGGPHMNCIGAKAIAFHEAQQPEFRTYGEAVLVNASALAMRLLHHGVELVTGGTENHIVVMNCFNSFGLGGKQAQDLLEAAGLSTNRNAVPNDPRKPFDPSGIRLGSPAMTTRGLNEEDFRHIADLIVEVLRAEGDLDKIAGIKEHVKSFCAKYPAPYDNFLESKV